MLRPTQRRFQRSELAKFDGRQEGVPILVAYRGLVYDVTESYPWRKGVHWACASAGRDETGKMAKAPHGPELLGRVPCIGWLID